MRIGLGINPDMLVKAKGEALSIYLSESGAQQASWQIDVWAEIDARGSQAGRGRGKKPVVFVGTINTVSGVNSGQLDRIVGQAVCPGALTWILRATGPAPGFTPPGFAVPIDAMAELDAAPGACCGATTGAYYPNNPGRVLTNSLTGFSGVVFTSPILLLGFFGFAGLSFTAIEDYLMFFNSPTVPANGTAPFMGLQFAISVGSEFNFSLSNPIFFPLGLSWAVSSTSGTLTLSPDVFNVTTRTQW